MHANSCESPTSKLALVVIVGLGCGALVPLQAEAQLLDRLKQARQQAERLLQDAIRCTFDDSKCIAAAKAQKKPVVLTDKDGTVLTDDKGQPVTDPERLPAAMQAQASQPKDTQPARQQVQAQELLENAIRCYIFDSACIANNRNQKRLVVLTDAPPKRCPRPACPGEGNVITDKQGRPITSLEQFLEQAPAAPEVADGHGAVVFSSPYAHWGRSGEAVLACDPRHGFNLVVRAQPSPGGSGDPEINLHIRHRVGGSISFRSVFDLIPTADEWVLPLPAPHLPGPSELPATLTPRLSVVVNAGSDDYVHLRSNARSEPIRMGTLRLTKTPDGQLVAAVRAVGQAHVGAQGQETRGVPVLLSVAVRARPGPTCQ